MWLFKEESLQPIYEELSGYENPYMAVENGLIVPIKSNPQVWNDHGVRMS